MLLSIVTPVYNGEKYIKETMDSIHSQSYSNFEHIVMDGGSKDGTVSIVKQYPKATLISQPDKGQTDAINKGFRQTKGDILAWQNADDIYLPDAFEIVIRFFEKNPGVDIVYGSYQVIDSESKWQFDVHSKRWNTWTFSHGLFVPMQPTVFWRRQVYEKIGDLDIQLKYCMDVDFFAKASKHFRFKEIPAFLGQFRVHDESKTHTPNIRQKVLSEKKAVLDANFGYTAVDSLFFSLFSFRSWLGEHLKPFFKKL